MNETLPSSWEYPELQQVAELGPKFDSSDIADREPVHFVPMAAVSEEFGGIDVSQKRSLSEVRKGYTYFAEGDVLFAKITPCMENGKGGLVPRLERHHAFGSTEFHVLRPSEAIAGQWLAHFLSQPSFRKAARQNMTGTAGQLRVPAKWLQTVRVPVPPRSEQTRIVAKLEELLSDLDAGVAELKAAQKKLQQYRQSLLKAAVDGALTADWREAQRQQGTPTETGGQLLARILTERRARWEAKQLAKFKEQGKAPPKDWQKKYPEPAEPDTSVLRALPNGWAWATIDQLTVEQRYGSSAKTSEDSTGIPVLRMGNIQDGALDYGNLKYLPKTHDEFPHLFLEDGDLLFNRTNSPELVGKSAIYRSERTPCSYASYLIAVRFAEGYISEIASAYINSAYGRHWVKSVVVQQVGQANVNGSKLALLAVPVPPSREQAELVRMLSEQTASAAEQERDIERLLRQSAAQRQNILRAAFAGELVPQDADEEPASLLLERIRAERPDRTSQPRPRKSRITPRP